MDHTMAPGTVSNKIFEYLSFGLPVISSLQGELETIITRHGFGVSYRPGDTAGLTAALCTVLDNADRQAAMRAAATTFFAAHGDSHAILEHYAASIEELADEKRTQ